MATLVFPVRHDGGVTDREVLISVDVEASGPSPSTGCLVAIGACRVDDPDVGFYVELVPIPGVPWHADAEAVHGLSPTYLAQYGGAPEAAMARFADWIAEAAGDARPVMVGFNATFDWMFVADYFHRFLGRNPFGISAMDLKAVYLGRFHVPNWSETTKRHVTQRLPVALPHTHNALDDARMQAELARALLGFDHEGMR
jgi:DNA polymerase III epsilon subunit-like protein